jgi:hypothetical protein
VPEIGPQSAGLVERWPAPGLVFHRGEVDICHRDPGFEVDLIVSISLRNLTRIWLGHLGIAQALREERLSRDGAPRCVAAFRSWFALSLFAPAGAAPGGQRELAASQ